MSVKCAFNFDSDLNIVNGVLKDDTGSTSWEVWRLANCTVIGH